MSANIRDAWVLPFLKIAPWVLAHPDGKRFPIKARYRQPGMTNLEVFCANWRLLADEYPALILDSDDAIVGPVFAALDRKEARS